MKPAQIKYISFTVIFLAIIAINAYLINSQILGLISAVAGLAVFGKMIGKYMAPGELGASQTFIGSLVLIAFWAIAGTILYYFGTISKTSVVVLIMLTPVLAHFIAMRAPKQKKDEVFLDSEKHKLSPYSILSAASALLLVSLAISVLAKTEILHATRSPWLEISSSYFYYLIPASALVCALAFRGRERAWILPLLMVLTFSIIGAALLSYPLGFGFDSFIHRATEDHIAKFGTITPKPFYYIGQYALVLIANHGFSIPIGIADRFLLPVITAIFIPLTAYIGFAHALSSKRTAIFATIAILLIPLSNFTVTTPQGLSLFWLLCLVLLSLPILMGRAAR
ncbi:TPA: hypothetical protein DCZ32_01240, partial [Candidatus Uhrbacteria bacterium]|nr:hypothetical protein [Candidatus Uhrbacteria bacterium]